MELTQLLIGAGVLILGNLLPKLHLGWLSTILQNVFARPATPAQPAQPGQPSQPATPQPATPSPDSHRPILEALVAALPLILAQVLKQLGVPAPQNDQGKVDLMSASPIEESPVHAVEFGGYKIELIPRITRMESVTPPA